MLRWCDAMNNNIELKIESKQYNVSIARVTIASFLSKMNITVDELSDIKTAVSEAVTNSIDHGYPGRDNGEIIIRAQIASIDDMSYVSIEVEDFGEGIADVELATQTAYTSKPELEHAGMGFTIMETFMDEIVIDSEVNKGTKITMSKRLKSLRE